MNTMNTTANLTEGQLITINIKNPQTYTHDLYKSIQGKTGKVVRKYELSSGIYDNDCEAYLIEFNEPTTASYYETHNGRWGGSEPKMNWWTKVKDFTINPLN